MATRWLTTPMRATCGADAMMRSTSRALASSSLKPGQSTAILPGASGQSCGAPGAIAARTSTAAASSSYSTTTRSAASSAASRVSATTSATAWPTCITRSPASAGRNGTCSGLPPLPGSGGQRDTLPTPAFSMSAAVSTASTPGKPRAPSISSLRMRACACGERTNTPTHWPGRAASSMKRPRPRRSASSSMRGCQCGCAVMRARCSLNCRIHGD